jgi:hypothetical protein
MPGGENDIPFVCDSGDRQFLPFRGPFYLDHSKKASCDQLDVQIFDMQLAAGHASCWHMLARGMHGKRGERAGYIKPLSWRIRVTCFTS